MAFPSPLACCMCCVHVHSACTSLCVCRSELILNWWYFVGIHIDFIFYFLHIFILGFSLECLCVSLDMCVSVYVWICFSGVQGGCLCE